MSRIVAFALGFMVSCAPVPQDAPPSRANALTSILPPMRVFDAPVVTQPTRSNVEIAQDFLDLSFRMESGRAVPQLTRFQGPITVRITGATNDTMVRDLEKLLGRLRKEAGINIKMVAADQPAASRLAVRSAGQARAQGLRNTHMAACKLVTTRTRHSLHSTQQRMSIAPTATPAFTQPISPCSNPRFHWPKATPKPPLNAPTAVWTSHKSIKTPPCCRH